MAVKRTITLRGTPYINEDGVTATTIYPGYLVDGVTTIAAHAAAAADVQRSFALERDEMGKDIDDYYSSGDTVKVGVFKPGERVLAYVASGQTISVNQKLESAGDGTLCAVASGVVLARALEAITATALTRIKVEVI